MNCRKCFSRAAPLQREMKIEVRRQSFSMPLAAAFMKCAYRSKISISMLESVFCCFFFLFLLVKFHVVCIAFCFRFFFLFKNKLRSCTQPSMLFAKTKKTMIGTSIDKVRERYKKIMNFKFHPKTSPFDKKITIRYRI